MTASGLGCSMQEYFNGPNKDESKDAKSPRQDNGVRTDTWWEGDSWDVEPETRDRYDRNSVNGDYPWRKPARLDRTATAELDDENKGKDGGSGCAGQRPSDGVRDVKEI